MYKVSGTCHLLPLFVDLACTSIPPSQQLLPSCKCARSRVAGAFFEESPRRHIHSSWVVGVAARHPHPWRLVLLHSFRDEREVHSVAMRGMQRPAEWSLVAQRDSKPNPRQRCGYGEIPLELPRRTRRPVEKLVQRCISSVGPIGLATALPPQ
ncbi:hypothetical protein GQ53DRAFT_746531 [Thozetella sp. PMI_491]|nr:hypothetical protein GQ53DRAFT_746531 [Thozetella sp. PMI_491]